MSTPRIRFSAAPSGTESTARARTPLPGLLHPPGSRGGGASLDDPLLANVVATQSWTLDGTARSGRGETVELPPDSADTRVLALEASDGTTIFLRADALAERLAQRARASGEVQGSLDTVDLDALRPRDGTSRGVSDWIWHRLTTLVIGDDGIIDAARDKLAELTGKIGEDLAVAAGTWAGAKAIVWAVETRGRNAPGLYAWQGGALDGGARLVDDAPQLQALASKPGLIFIHGTGSHTLGAFGRLPDSQSWPALAEHFEGRLFGFEHHSFSESPIDNALALATLLPKNARISLVTHSRGGLVGDLLCLDASTTGKPVLTELAQAYRAPGHQQDKRADDPATQAEHAAFVALEQKKLGTLIQLLAEKNLQIERYVRVACPARGTALLSENLDIFLSGLLNVMRRLGDLGVGLAVGASQGPTAGSKATAAVDRGISVLTRIVLEIAKRRLRPELLPGIEAMLPDAPMGRLLALAPARPGLRMAVVAGDIEGGGLLQRLGTLFTDRKFFDQADNDLVVDTASMYGGLAGQRPTEARAIFVQGPGVSHFRYFRDDTTTADGHPLPAAQLRWLTDAAPLALAEWITPALPDDREAVRPPEAPSLARGVAPESAPLLVFLPGIMGSKLNADGARVWLAPQRLALGGISQIAMNTKAKVTVDGLIGMAYGDLYAHLGRTHVLECFDYDWRQPILDLGKALARRLRERVPDPSKRPVHILAHSMGGLVVRAAFAQDETLWQDIAAHPDSALLMLGTPNRGSHLFVETLLGQSDTIRTLAGFDQHHRLQQILDIVAAFPGAVQLLPAPGFIDTGDIQQHAYYERSTWDALAAVNDDFWFGKQLGGKPSEKRLADAKTFWNMVSDTRWVGTATDRIAYVFGQRDNTPCGILKQVDGAGNAIGIVLRGTPDGDGSVTWASGRLAGLPDERQWLMPADHMGLTSTPEFFDDITALLTGGVPRKLGKLPTSRGEATAATVINYRAAPPPGFPSEAEATATALGGRVRRGPPRGKARLRVSVIAMDLRFVQVPVLCGHYRGDPIAGAERIIDRNLVDGALAQRQRLGIHSGELGNASIVLMPRTPEERWRGTGRGAIVVGLGEMGKLSAAGITETVRGGVLRYLLHATDRHGDEQFTPTRRGVPAPDPNQPLPLKLASLLIGSNSALQLDVADAVKAVTLGVLMANHDFAGGKSGDGSPPPRRARVAELQFIEVFRDSAISAANAVSQLDTALATELPGLDQQLDLADQLAFGQGVRRRLSVSPFSDYWPRLVVCDADRDETGCSPECYTPRFQSPIPPDTLRQILRLYGCADTLAGRRLPVPTGLDDAPSPSVANRLKFIYMSDKARAESVVPLRQPGAVETLCQKAFEGGDPTRYLPALSFGNTLFQMLVPVEFKAAARQTGNLILMVDGASANLPWEMLEVDGKPMVLSTRVVRQFVTARFRHQVVRTDTLTACVISNPSTDGFHAQFGGPGWTPRNTPDGSPEPDCLRDLPGATAEGQVVQRVLGEAGYAVTPVPPDASAGDVFARLFARPYRILMISAHGIHALQAADGSYRSGVVLSDGLLLSASEIGLMENVPDLVFLNCCHLGKIGPEAGTGSNRLAYSLARELIDMGVRCVVAAGWEVDDTAAHTFTEVFFDQMANRNAGFGDALREARRATFAAHPERNTWGAYQAYGDPAFQLKVQRGPEPDDRALRAPDELLDWIEQRRLDSQLIHTATARQTTGRSPRDPSYKELEQRLRRRLKHVPTAWLDMPEINEALGRLHAEFGAEGFAAARAAYLRAISDDSSRGLVPIAAIEQLANLEARQAQRLGEKGQTDAAMAHVDDAIARLQALLALSADKPADPAGSAATDRVNTERLAILGSAYKRKAIVLAHAEQPWQAVAAELALARDAYARSAGQMTGSADWNPYNYLNQIQLDALLGTCPADLADALAQCAEAANARFGRSYAFFDAVMPADAEVARWLHTGEGDVQRLACAYNDAMRGLTRSRRELDSVIAQLRILAGLLRCRVKSLAGDASAPDARRIQVLDELIVTLGEEIPPPRDGGPGAPTNGASPATTPG